MPPFINTYSVPGTINWAPWILWDWHYCPDITDEETELERSSSHIKQVAESGSKLKFIWLQSNILFIMYYFLCDARNSV